MRAQIGITLPRLTVAIALAAVGFLSVGAMAADERVPPGTYMTTITPEDIPASFQPEAAQILIGQWQLEFTDNGIAFVTKDGELVVTTRYRSNPARLILQDQSGSLACLPSGRRCLCLGVGGRRLNANRGSGYLWRTCLGPDQQLICRLNTVKTFRAALQRTIMLVFTSGAGWRAAEYVSQD
jgi:hypothetical protein